MVSDSSFMFGTGGQNGDLWHWIRLVSVTEPAKTLGSVPAAEVGKRYCRYPDCLVKRLALGLSHCASSIFPKENITIVLWIGGGVANGWVYYLYSPLGA